jgi:hypothetical protein
MIEVLKQLVEASEELSFAVRSKGVIKTVKALSKTKEAIQVGKQAIAQLALDAKAENARELGLDYEQEPVAWVAEDVCEGQYIDGRPRKIWWECNKGVGMAFYTHPPQRTWVGLTDEEIEQGYETSGCYQRLRLQDKFAVYALAKAIEAKLKEKNT